MRLSRITPVFVESAPDRLSEGVLYVSERYQTALHKCCCGCGQEVVTPLTRADWSLRKRGNSVSLHPSIGNWDFPCKSHYWIRNNEVIWASSLSTRQIAIVRRQDKLDKQRYQQQVNRLKVADPAPPAGVFQSSWRWLTAR